jgi:predicted TIM-barrel fold metal-dependent hydrolase
MEDDLGSRRRIAGLLAAVVALHPAQGASGQSSADGVFIDGHVHLNDPAAWVRLMDAASIERAIVFRGRNIDNAGLIEAARRWPDRLIPFLSVSPEHREFRGAWAAEDDGLDAIVDSLLSSGGFRGIGEISVSHFAGAGFPEADFDPDGRVMRGILDAARRHAVPVTVHVEVTRLREFEAVLERYRDVTVIWAHGGYTPLVLAERLLGAHPNLVYELSARTWARHPRSPDYTILRDDHDVWPEWLALVRRMPARFVMGTDASLRSIEGDQEKIRSVTNFLNQLPADVRRQVATENLKRILRLGP